MANPYTEIRHALQSQCKRRAIERAELGRQLPQQYQTAQSQYARAQARVSQLTEKLESARAAVKTQRRAVMALEAKALKERVPLS